MYFPCALVVGRVADCMIRKGLCCQAILLFSLNTSLLRPPVDKTVQVFTHIASWEKKRNYFYQHCKALILIYGSFDLAYQALGLHPQSLRSEPLCAA